MIVVTGATGQLGREVVERLLARVPAEQVGVSVRAPEKAAHLAERGVRVRRGDFAEPDSLAHAFEGATKVLLVSVNTAGEDTVRQHATAIEAAKLAGAKRILYTSQMGANPRSAFAPMRDHAATEALLADSGVPFTSLRNGYYAASAAMMLYSAADTGELVTPEDGPFAWTTHADLADAAATALTEDGLDGITSPLTGTEAIDMAGVAAVASRVTGREIRRVVVSDDEYRERLVSRGLPTELADLFVGMFVAGRQGEFATTDPALSRLLARTPMSFADFLATTTE